MTRRPRLLLALLAGLGLGLGLAAPAMAASAETTKLDVVRNAIDGYIRPGYAAMASDAAAMAAAQAALCDRPSAERLSEARQAFAGLVASHARIEFVRFGPIVTDNRAERFLFWPDPKGIALRQVQAIIGGASDAAATDAKGLRGKSVAVQGLGALEFVLFGTGADSLAGAEGAFRCRYGAAIAENLSLIARDVSAEWRAGAGFAESLTNPAPRRPAYRSIDDSLEEVVGIFIFGFEAIRDLRLQPAIGASLEKANPNAWIYRRSNLTKTSLQADFTGLADLFKASKLGGVLPTPQHWLADTLSFEFGNAGRALQTIGAPLKDAVTSPDERVRLATLLTLTQTLQRTFTDQLAPALGFSAGFSSLDGD